MCYQRRLCDRAAIAAARANHNMDACHLRIFRRLRPEFNSVRIREFIHDCATFDLIWNVPADERIPVDEAKLDQELNQHIDSYCDQVNLGLGYLETDDGRTILIPYAAIYRSFEECSRAMFAFDASPEARVFLRSIKALFNRRLAPDTLTAIYMLTFVSLFIKIRRRPMSAPVTPADILSLGIALLAKLRRES
jgi:hypothetical protein